jgi:hypothetical protein
MNTLVDYSEILSNTPTKTFVKRFLEDKIQVVLQVN